MIRTKDVLIIDQRTEEQKLRDAERAKEISDLTLEFDPIKNNKISFGVSLDSKNLIDTMGELAHMSISEFLRYLINEEHRRLITIIRDGVAIEAETEEDRQRIFDQIMRSVL
jgi:hypothetical protein